MKFTRISIAVVALLSMSAARAEDLIKIAIGQRGVFENSFLRLAKTAGSSRNTD